MRTLDVAAFVLFVIAAIVYVVSPGALEGRLAPALVAAGLACYVAPLAFHLT